MGLEIINLSEIQLAVSSMCKQFQNFLIRIIRVKSNSRYLFNLLYLMLECCAMFHDLVSFFIPLHFSINSLKNYIANDLILTWVHAQKSSQHQ